MKFLRKITALSAALIMAVSALSSSVPAASVIDGAPAVSARPAASFTGSAPSAGDIPEGKLSGTELTFTAGNIATAGGYTIYGFVNRHSEGYSSVTDSVIHIEADYGLTETSKKMNLYVSGYNHTKKDLKIKSAVITGVSQGSKGFEKDIKIKMNEKTKINTKKFKTGLYMITATFSNKKKLNIFFYVNTDAVSTCYAEKISSKTAVTRRRALTKAINKTSEDNINGGFERDGSKSLALDKFYYPNYTFGNAAKYRCDTKRWMEKSDKIVNKNWSDEHKAYVMLVWLMNNIAYDSYILDRDSRSCATDDWSGKNSTWNLRTGVCWDFANIYAIMCRAQGIPCTSISTASENHMWNLVLINGRWIEVDISSYARYETYKKDADDRTRCYDGDRSFRQYAFSMYPNWDTKMPDDIVVNGDLMYGDPEDTKSPVHFVY